MHIQRNTVQLLKKNKEILKCEKTWTNPENIMLSKVSQVLIDKHCMIPVI